MKISELRTLPVVYHCQPITADESDGFSCADTVLGRCFNFDAFNLKLDSAEENFAFYIGRERRYVPKKLLDPTTAENFSVALSLSDEVFNIDVDCDNCMYRGDDCDASDKEIKECSKVLREREEFIIKELADRTYKIDTSSKLSNVSKIEVDDEDVKYFIYASFNQIPVKQSIRKSKYTKIEEYIYKLNSLTIVRGDEVYFYDTKLVEDMSFFSTGEEFIPLDEPEYDPSDWWYKQLFEDKIEMLRDIPTSDKRLVAYGLMLSDPKKYGNFYYYHLVHGWGKIPY